MARSTGIITSTFASIPIGRNFIKPGSASQYGVYPQYKKTGSGTAQKNGHVVHFNGSTTVIRIS